MNNEFGLDELNELLNEKIDIEEIIFPTINQRIIHNEENKKIGIEYNFENGEKFEGLMDNNKLKSGIYTWPNRQQYKGNFSENNNFRKGEIIFYPSNNKLIGTYEENKEIFEKCIYETDSYIYEGNVKRNKLHGNSSIKSKENKPYYSFKGKYEEGKRKGRCEIINEKNEIKYKINGLYRYGKKNGDFKVYNLENNELIFNCTFINDIQLIEKDSFNEIRKNININCIEILNKDNKFILLLGTENNIFLYDIIRQQNLSELKFNNQGNISDIIALRDKNILVCNDENKFYLIDIKINRNNIKAELISQFNGRDNSSNIFSMLELQNGLIASGDCNNLIFWEKDFIYRNYNINNNNKNIIEIENDSNNNEINIYDSIKSIFFNCYENINNFFNGENNNQIELYSYKELNHIPLTHTYCFLEIKERFLGNNDNVIIAIAQPDNESVKLFDISFIRNNININNQNEIRNINSTINRKNIMACKNNILYIGCKDSIKLIQLNNINDAFVISDILIRNISYINFYRNEFLLCGINKNRSEYNFESKLIQLELKQNNIIPLNEYNQHRHNGSIINNIIFHDNNEEYFITLGTDKKIIITHTTLNEE